MRWLVACLLTSSIVLLPGCASVQVQRGQDLSSAGVAYAQATAAVIDLAMDASIDVSSQRLVSVVARPARDEAEAEARKARLREGDGLLIAQTQSYARIKKSVGAVQAYFAGLQQLAGANPGEAVEASVQTLADRVNSTSTALGGEARLNDERKGAVAGLARLVVQQAHGAALARALQRDAPVIGRALALQEITLQVAVGDLQALANEQDARFYRRQVLEPYGQGGVGSGWADDRRQYIKSQALGTAAEAVTTASAAARQMQDAWGRILSGQSSGVALNLMLKDLNDALDTAHALKKAF